MPDHVCDEGGCEIGGQKPPVDRVVNSSHWYARGGADIDHIVIHYTTSRNIDGTIEHFLNGTPRNSAHYIVGRDGELVQVVADSRGAWHAGSQTMNKRSIGIEHVARAGDRLTPEQSEKSLALIGWLMQAYDIPRANVIPHKCVKNTDCLGDILGDYGATIGSDCEEQRAAIDKWLSTAGL